MQNSGREFSILLQLFEISRLPALVEPGFKRAVKPQN
jgi:hypothetical protein